MIRTTHIWNRHKKVILFYGLLLFICFIAVYFLASPFFPVQFCGDGIQFFSRESCGNGIRPLIVSMNAETLNSRVASLLPPFSYTEGVGWHILGTDALGRDVFAGILYGGQRSLVIGFLSGGLAMLLGWFLGLWSVYVRWSQSRFSILWVGLAVILIMSFLTGQYLLLLFVPGILMVRMWVRKKQNTYTDSTTKSWLWGRWIEWYQALPDLLLLLVLSSVIGIINMWSLIIIIVAVIWPAMALIARRMADETGQQPYFAQALRNKIPGKDLMYRYLWGNTKSVFMAFFPLVVARVILLESTLSFLGMGLPPDIVTIGSMVSSARFNISAWWLIVFSCLFIFILVYPLITIGMQSSRQRFRQDATSPRARR